MSSVDPFIDCLNERVAGGPFKISKKLTGSFRDQLITELYRKNGNFTLNDFLDFLKDFSIDLDNKNKKIIGDLSKPKDRKWWADVLGMVLESDLDKLIVRDYEAIFNPGKKRIMGFQIQGKVEGLKDCLNEELEMKKPGGSPFSDLSGVSSPDLSSESRPLSEPEPEPVPVPMKKERKRKEERRMDPYDDQMYTKQEFYENYSGYEEWEEAKTEKNYSELSLEEKAERLKPLHSTDARAFMGRINKRKKYKKRKRRSNKSNKKTKKIKKKKTKKRIKR